jgi:drug/metabolite transporter (DMT)-like permease
MTSSDHKADRLALIVLITGAAVLSLSAVLVRVTATGPAAAGFWRLTCALPLLAVLARREGRDALPRSGPEWRILAGAAAMFCADMACWHYSLHLTSVANSTVLANLTPVLLTLVGWLVFKERPAAIFLAGLALAVAGAGAMGLSPNGGGRGTNPPLGDTLAVITTVWYGLYFLAVRAARKTMGAMKVMLGSSLLGAPIILVVALALHERIWPGSLWGWVACLGLGVVHVSGQGSIAWSLGRLPAALAAVVVLIQPVVAAGLSWLMFGEAIGPLQAVGGLMALAGVALAQAAPRAKPTPVAGEAEALG